MESKIFLNWSNEEFVGMWDSIPYKFKPGQSVYLEDWKAAHFAKHLTDRELQKAGYGTADQRRAQFYSKCFVEETIEQNAPAAEIAKEVAELPVETQILNKNKNLGRPKKVAVEVANEEFEGLDK